MTGSQYRFIQLWQNVLRLDDWDPEVDLDGRVYKLSELLRIVTMLMTAHLAEQCPDSTVDTQGRPITPVDDTILVSDEEATQPLEE